MTKDMNELRKIASGKRPANFYQKKRHIRWNYELSPESSEGNEKVRYHFIIQDDKYREGKMEKIMDSFNAKSIIDYSFDEMNKIEGKSGGTDYRYLFLSYDTNAPTNFLSFDGISKNIKRDGDLRERKVGSIEDYVRRIYEK